MIFDFRGKNFEGRIWKINNKWTVNARFSNNFFFENCNLKSSIAGNKLKTIWLISII